MRSMAVLDSPVALLSPAWATACVVLLDGPALPVLPEGTFALWPAAWVLAAAGGCAIAVWFGGRADQARTRRSPDSE